MKIIMKNNDDSNLIVFFNIKMLLSLQIPNSCLLATTFAQKQFLLIC